MALTKSAETIDFSLNMQFHSSGLILLKVKNCNKNVGLLVTQWMAGNKRDGAQTFYE
ncbi:MAG: hypothetical protein F6K31_22475 [Symploca sp. SIO2G7]|nr:hypothetical protein [Symploca sp. SIO2G7]